MGRTETIRLLAEHAEELRSHYGVQSLFLFGSVARGEDTRSSDVDLIVEFTPGERVGLFRFLDLKEYLERLLGRPVDLVTRDALKPRLRASILAELVHVR